jgi:hypothetical protein
MFGARQWICHAASLIWQRSRDRARVRHLDTNADRDADEDAAGPSERSDAAERDDLMMMVRRQPSSHLNGQ